MSEKEPAPLAPQAPAAEIAYFAEDMTAPAKPAFNSHSLPDETGKRVATRFHAGEARQVSKAAMELLVAANQKGGVVAFKITMGAPDGAEFNPSNFETLDLFGMLDAITIENRGRGERLAGLIASEIEKHVEKAREDAIGNAYPPGHVLAKLEDLTIDALMEHVAKYPGAEKLTRNSGKPILMAFVLSHQTELANRRKANAGQEAAEAEDGKAGPG